MSRASAARRLATAAAFGGGGLGVFGGALYGILRAEAAVARRRIGFTDLPVPDPTGVYGAHLQGPEIRLAILGDSAAAGYGAAAPSETFGSFLAIGLSDVLKRPVSLTCVATVGSQTADLERQVPLALTGPPDVCVIIIGANDVTHNVSPSRSLRYLQDAIESLRNAGCEVVVGTCPDLGTLRPVSPPLRQVARLMSRRLAAGQTVTTVETGGRSVSLGTILGPEFAASPADMFGPDQFHPSPAGYKSCAGAMLPSVAAAVTGVPVELEEAPEYTRGEGVFSIGEAAAEAVETTGTEVSRATVAGGDHGPRGRWVLLRRRRRHVIPEPSDVELESDTDTPDPASTSGDGVR